MRSKTDRERSQDSWRDEAHRRHWAVRWGAFAAVPIALALAAGAEARPKKPKPESNGLEWCILQDVDGDPSVDYVTNTCCIDVEDQDGERTIYCIQCDQDWESCDWYEGGASGPRGGGTISEPRRPNPGAGPRDPGGAISEKPKKKTPMTPSVRGKSVR